MLKEYAGIRWSVRAWRCFANTSSSLHALKDHVFFGERNLSIMHELVIACVGISQRG